jgi:hypothetical protein
MALMLLGYRHVGDHPVGLVRLMGTMHNAVTPQFVDPPQLQTAVTAQHHCGWDLRCTHAKL